MARSVPSDERTLPHSLEAERSVLGAIVIQNDVFDLAAQIINSRDFYRDAHRRVFATMAAMRERGDAIDFVTIKEELSRNGNLDDVGGPAYVASLADGVPRATNAEYYARIVKEKSSLRSIIYAGNAAVSAAYEGDGERAVDAFRTLATQVAAAQPDTAPAQLRSYRAHELVDQPRPVEVIEGVAWAGLVTVIVSESGTGKTFVGLDSGAAVSEGRNWLGRRTLRGSVVYVTFEGDAMGVRLRGLIESQGRSLQHLHVVSATRPISPATTAGDERPSVGELDLQALLVDVAARIEKANEPPIREVVFDTARASMRGNEDDSDTVAAYIRAVKRIGAVVPTAALVVMHHAGWQDGESKRKRERGSSAWRGNADASFYLEQQGDYNRDTGEAALVLSTLKTRDGEKSAPLRMVRRRVTLSTLNQWGKPESTCIIEADPRTHEECRAEEMAGELARAAAVASDYDKRVLRAIADNPEVAINQDGLRMLTGGRKTGVGDAISRLVSAGLVLLPAGRRKPYTLTPAGVAVLSAEPGTSSEQFPGTNGTSSRRTQGTSSRSSQQFPEPVLQ